MEDLGAITWWLGILTVLVGVQSLVLTLVAVRGLRLIRRAETTLAEADRALTPIAARATEVMDDLRALGDTARRADQGVRTAIDRAQRGVQLVGLGMTRRFWPVLGVWAAGRAVAAAVRARRNARQSREDETAEARFDAEGGSIHDTR